MQILTLAAAKAKFFLKFYEVKFRCKIPGTEFNILKFQRQISRLKILRVFFKRLNFASKFYAIKFRAAALQSLLANAQSLKFYAIKFDALKFGAVSDPRAVWRQLR